MTTKRANFWREYFYFFMSLLIAATVVYNSILKSNCTT
jgi:hypothetical protein